MQPKPLHPLAREGPWLRPCKRQRTVPERTFYFTVGNLTTIWRQRSDKGSPSLGEQTGSGRKEDRGNSARSSGISFGIAEREVGLLSQDSLLGEEPAPGVGALRPNENGHESRTQRQTCPAS